MSRGRAEGVNRQYQVQVRDVLMFRHQGYLPYSGDGVDVSFSLGISPTVIDVALRNPAGEVLVAECKRYGPETTSKIKKDHLAAFDDKIRRLREHLSVPVTGTLIAKKRPQDGAIKDASDLGIEVGILSEGEAPPGFSISFVRYDRTLKKVCTDAVIHAPVIGFVVLGGDADLRKT